VFLDAGAEPGTCDALPVVTPGGSKTSKPSEWLLLLVDCSIEDDSDIQLRAYQIDHVLLWSVQTKRLQSEIHRCDERMTKSL
jgi:hypothetical protein